MKKFFLLILVVSICACSSIPDTFKEEVSYMYHYNQEDEKSQEIYRNIYNCIDNYETQVKIDATDLDYISGIVEDVLKDHPELFYLKSSQTVTLINESYYKPVYSYSQSEKERLEQQIESKVEQIVEMVSSLPIDQKIEKLYQYVCEHVTYNESAQDNQEIISALLNQQSVCSGYCKMLQYLLEKCDIESTYLICTAKDSNERHSILMIHYNNDYYYCDPTWGDQKGITLFTYCMFSSADLARNYEMDDVAQRTKDLSNTYLKKHHAYFTNYSYSSLPSLIQGKSLEVKYSHSIYNYAKSKLLTEGEIYKALNNIQSIQYIPIDSMDTLYIFWN